MTIVIITAIAAVAASVMAAYEGVTLFKEIKSE